MFRHLPLILQILLIIWIRNGSKYRKRVFSLGVCAQAQTPAINIKAVEMAECEDVYGAFA